MPGEAYQLADGRFGMDMAIQGDMDINENTMSVWIPFASGQRRDGVGDLLEIGGIRTDRHQLNPIILFDHGQKVQLPIALAEDPKTKVYTVELDPVSQTARANAFFYQGSDSEHAIFCEQLFDLMAKRYVRAGSIGYQIVKAMPLQPDYEKGTPQGLHLLSVLMLEASAVVMPANADTVRKVLCLNKVCGKSLSPILVKSLEPYAPPTKAMMLIPETKEVTVPLNEDLNKTKVPPAKWKPGLGAMKELRKKYKKIDDVLDNENNEQEEVEKDIVDKPKQKKPKSKLNFKIRHQNPAKENRKVSKVVSKPQRSSGKKDSIKRSGKTCKPGERSDLTGCEVSNKKSLPSQLRQKYRTLPNVRRRLKRSSPGSSVVHVKSEEFDTFSQEAEEKGLTVSRMKSSMNGMEKVRLDGDDKNIDHLAGKYGQVVQGRKSMSDVTTKEDYGADSPTEPYGAQVLRRIHEHHSMLMAEYDELIAATDKGAAQDFLRNVLEGIEKVLTGVEETFGKEYPDLDGLDVGGAEEATEAAAETGDPETKDMDTMEDDATPADSAPPEDEESDEEAPGMPGMKKLTKSIRSKYVKSAPCSCGKKGCSCGKFVKPGNEENSKKPGHDATGAEIPNEPGSEENQNKPGHDETGDEIPDEPGNEENKSYSFAPHHKQSISEARGYFKELGSEYNYGEEHRMKSYHYHKMLDAAAVDKPHIPNETGINPMLHEVERDIQSKAFQEVDDAEDNSKVQHPQVQAVKNASNYFKELAMTRDFGDPHREKCMSCSKSLDFIDQDKRAEVNEPDSSPDMTGEVDTKSLLLQFESQASAIDDLSKKLANLKIVG